MRWKVMAGAVLLAGTAGGVSLVAVSWNGPVEPVVQPIAFNHRLHVQDEGMECTECHMGAEEGLYAHVPPVRVCMLCHDEPMGEHPDEPRIREFFARGEEIPWRQVNRLPGHVHFSHAAHVRLAGMDCAGCHGDMAGATSPLGVPGIGHLTMKRCMDCHDEQGATNDCLGCHK